MHSLRFIARNENFGSTVFDKSTLKYFFMSEEEFNSFSRVHQVSILENTPYAEDSRILYAPIRIYYDITSVCNLRCKTCLNSSGVEGSSELSLEQSLSVVRGIKSDGIFEVKFSGGEPTQHPGWFEIFKLAKKLGLSVVLNSNGIYDFRTLDRLIGLELEEISISLDGGESVNDSIRGSGSYAKASSSIIALHNHGQNVKINSVVTALTTEDSIRELVEFGSKYAKVVSFFHARPLGRAKDSLIADYDRISALMKFAKELECCGRTKVGGESLRVNSLDERNAHLGLYSGGSDGFTRFNILPNGSLYAGGCVPYVRGEDSKYCLGSIVDENYSILNVWRKHPVLWNIRDLSHSLQARCNSCSEYDSNCGGFTMEMEVYKQAVGFNPFCVRGDL